MRRPQPDGRFNESEFRALLRHQHGLVTIQQAHALGISRDAIATRVRRGELERVLPRVYRSTLVAPSLREAALGAVLWAGEGAVASHTTAARILGAQVPGGKPHLWVPSGRGVRSGLVIVHRGEVAKNDHRIRDGVPVTSPARTLVDVASTLDDESLEAVFEDFLHRGLTTPLAVTRCLDAVGGTGRAGSRLLRALLSGRDTSPLESRLEVKLWRLLRKAGLRPVPQYEVRCGVAKYRLDFAFPVLKVAVEGQGFAAHGGRLAHVRDSRRLADLVGAGWRVVPVTWEDVTREPGQVIDRVRSTLLEAAA